MTTQTSDDTDQFVSDLVGNHIVGFLVLWLICLIHVYSVSLQLQGNVQVSVKVEDVDGNDNGIIGPKKTETFFSYRADRNETSSAWKPFEFTWHHAGGTVW